MLEHNIKKMDENSKRTLQRLEQNNYATNYLQILASAHVSLAHYNFISNDGDDYTRLGTAIAKNTYLAQLIQLGTTVQTS